MARREIQSDGARMNVPAPAESASSGQDGGWFEEFARVTFDLSMTLNRTVILSGIIALGALAFVYLGAYTERYYVAAGAMAVFALAMLVFGAAIFYTAWAVFIGSVKWWRANRRGSAESEKQQITNCD